MEWIYLNVSGNMHYHEDGTPRAQNTNEKLYGRREWCTENKCDEKKFKTPIVITAMRKRAPNTRSHTHTHTYIATCTLTIAEQKNEQKQLEALKSQSMSNTQSVFFV